MVNCNAVPEQVIPFEIKLGITVIVATNGVIPALTAINEGREPVPFKGTKPIFAPVLLQLNITPGVALENITAGTVAPVQYTWLGIGFIIGVGLTDIVNITGIPGQVIPPAVILDVTVMVDTNKLLPKLVAVKEGKEPVPFNGIKPMLSPVLLQLKITPGVVLVNTMEGTIAPVQKALFGIGLISGLGSTDIVNTTGVPLQVIPPAVILDVTVIVDTNKLGPVLVAVKEGKDPVPFNGINPILSPVLLQLNTTPGVVLLKIMVGTIAPAQ